MVKNTFGRALAAAIAGLTLFGVTEAATQRSAEMSPIAINEENAEPVGSGGLMEDAVDEVINNLENPGNPDNLESENS